MLKYKLTTQQNQTHNGFQWISGEPRSASGEGGLCGPGWLHYYHSPELAILLNPIHANIANPKLWEIEAEGLHKDDNGLKGGCTQLTLLREIPLPVFSTKQRIKFAILCAKKVFLDKKWNDWADDYLSGKDTSANAAYAAYAAAKTAFAAAKAAKAAEAAEAASYAAAYAANAVNAANAAAEAAANAAYAAEAAANAADAAAEAAANAAAPTSNLTFFHEIISTL